MYGAVPDTILPIPIRVQPLGLELATVPAVAFNEPHAKVDQRTMSADLCTRIFVRHVSHDLEELLQGLHLLVFLAKLCFHKRLVEADSFHCWQRQSPRGGRTVPAHTIHHETASDDKIVSDSRALHCD